MSILSNYYNLNSVEKVELLHVAANRVFIDLLVKRLSEVRDQMCNLSTSDDDSSLALYYRQLQYEKDIINDLLETFNVVKREVLNQEDTLNVVTQI